MLLLSATLFESWVLLFPVVFDFLDEDFFKMRFIILMSFECLMVGLCKSWADGDFSVS